MGESAQTCRWADSNRVVSMVESLHAELVCVNRLIRDPSGIEADSRAEELEGLRQRSEELRDALDDLDFHSLTTADLPTSSSVWSDSLGSYIRLIQQFTTDEQSPNAIDSEEMQILSNAAARSSDFGVRFLFFSMIVEDRDQNPGTFVTRYGGNTSFIDDYEASAIGGVNLCLNLQDKPLMLPCIERGIWDHNYAIDENALVSVAPSVFPTIAPELKKAFSTKAIEQLRAPSDPVAIIKTMREQITNTTIFSLLTYTLFEKLRTPAAATVFQTTLANIVSLEPALDRKTKQIYGTIIDKAARSWFPKQAEDFAAKTLAHLTHRQHIPAGSVVGADGNTNRAASTMTSFHPEIAADLLKGMQKEIRATLQVIESVGDFMAAHVAQPQQCIEGPRSPWEKTPANLVLIDAWRTSFSDDLSELTGLSDADGSIEHFLDMPIDLTDAEGYTFLSKVLTKTEISWNDAMITYSERRDTLSRLFFDRNRDVDEAFAAARADQDVQYLSGGAGALAGLRAQTMLGQMGSAIVPFFIASMAGGYWNKTSQAIESQEQDLPIPVPRPRSGFPKSAEGMGETGALERYQIEAQEWNRFIQALPNEEQFAFQVDEPVRIDCTSDADLCSLETGFAGMPIAAAVDRKAIGDALRGIKDRIGTHLPKARRLIPGQCEVFGLSAAVFDLAAWRRFQFSAETSVRPFVTGIDADGEFIRQTPVQIGGHLWPALGALAVAAGYGVCRTYAIRHGGKKDPPKEPKTADRAPKPVVDAKKLVEPAAYTIATLFAAYMAKRAAAAAAIAMADGPEPFVADALAGGFLIGSVLTFPFYYNEGIE